jgi:DNA-binding CsgD family transcriptional regulator
VHREVYGGTGLRTRSRLIGREAALDALRAEYGRAGASRSSVVLLWGEAGVGKTRLLDEFRGLARADGARVGSASCFQGLCPAFAPLQESFAELELPTPFEGGAAAAPLIDVQAKRYESFRAAASALRTPGVRTVLIIDDLHWADFATLEFLAFLAHHTAGGEVAVLAAVRSEHLELDHARLEALDTIIRHGGRRLDVEPLTDSDMRVLVATLWPGESPKRSEVDRICSLAEGKPYFAEELVNSALTARFAQPGALPLSIRAGVLARFERLSPQDRNVLLRASVIGRNFDPLLLERLAGVPGSGVLEALTQARELQLVREAGDAGAFAFRHAITREILYRELPSFAARAIHRELAALLEKNLAADPAGVAHHWNAAGDPARATQAYELAGDRAFARHAHADAEAAYRAAIDSRTQTAPAFPELCEKLQRVFSINGNLDEACALGRLAVDGYAAAGESAKAAVLSIRLARRHFEAGRPTEAQELAHLGLRFCQERGPTAYDARITLAHFAALHGKIDDAAEQLRLAELVAADREPGQLRTFHLVRAATRAAQGRLGAAFEDYEESVALARKLDDPEQLAWTLSNYASRAIATGHTHRALRAYAEAVNIAPPESFGKIGGMAIQGLAHTHLLAGELETARRAHARGRQARGSSTALTRTGDLVIELRLAFFGGETLTTEPAGTGEALEIAFASGETQNIGLLAGCLAAYYDAAGRPNEARALRTRALPALTSVDLSLWLLDQFASSEDSGERGKARALLAAAAVDPQDVAARAHLTLFDARVARRERNVALAKTLALQAAEGFAAIGWPCERAAALEVAGRHAEAAEIYQRHGYVRQQRELGLARRRARHRAASHRLTQRESEIVRLAAAEKTNREIAAQLFISERTVETHIAAVFDRFEISSRRQLAALVDESESARSS